MACASCATSTSSARATKRARLLRMAHSWRRPGGRLARQRLRIEVGDGEPVIDEILARDFLHLLARHRLQLLDEEIDQRIRKTHHRQRPDLLRLEKHRVALEYVR